MTKQPELQAKLEGILGSRNVYFQPPESKKLEYPAIRYSLRDIEFRHADNRKYSRMDSYELTVISKQPADEIIDRLLELPYCSFDRHYKADNLYHYTLILYY